MMRVTHAQHPRERSGEGGDVERDIWVEFNDIDASGRVVTYADLARPGVDLSVGAQVVAGDNEGNTARACVVARQRWRRNPRITLKLDLESFQPGPQELERVSKLS